MERILSFKDHLKTKNGVFEIVLVAVKANLNQFRGDGAGGILRYHDGSKVVGAEGYSDFRRTYQDKFLLKTVEVKFNGHRIPIPAKEWKAVVVSTLQPSPAARHYESGVQLFPDAAKDAVDVVLSGGDGVAAYILTWRFSGAQGFRGRVLQGPP